MVANETKARSTRGKKAPVVRTRTLEKADRYFCCSDRERAVFEAGIKLGTVYHQFTGTPVSRGNVDKVEVAIESSIAVQPFVSFVKVIIDRGKLSPATDQFDYMSLTGDMMDVDLEVRYRGATVRCGMEYKEELRYPLMFIRDVEGPGGRGCPG